MNDITKKKIFDNFMLIFILIQPFLDALTCIQVKSNFQFLSVSVICRGIAFVTILIYLIIRKDNRKSILFFIIIFKSIVSKSISSIHAIFKTIPYLS